MKREFLPSGWWYTYPSEKYEFVSWADEIPNTWKVIQNSMVPVTTNQPSKLTKPWKIATKILLGKSIV